MIPFVYEWKSSFGSTASKPESPPSPVTGSSQVGEPENASEPLSCVPAIAVSVGEDGDTEMLFIWSVARPAFMTCSCSGIRLSHWWQSARSAADNPRLSHWLDASAHVPFVRITPPSDASKN